MMMVVVAVQMEMSPTGNQWNQLMAAAGSCQHLLSLCFQPGSTSSSQAASTSSSISFTSCQHSELQSLLPNLPNLPPSSPTISLSSPLYLQTWYLSPALGGEQKDDDCWRGGRGEAGRSSKWWQLLTMGGWTGGSRNAQNWSDVICEQPLISTILTEITTKYHYHDHHGETQHCGSSPGETRRINILQVSLKSDPTFHWLAALHHHHSHYHWRRRF